MYQPFSFYKREQEQDFLNKGWFAVPLLSENDVAEMLKAFNDFHVNKNEIPPFSLCLPDYNRKKDVFTFLKNYFIPRLDAVLHSYRLTGANYYFKAAATAANTVPPHQDWTFVDERIASSINIWIPLVDVDKSNGAYHIIEGSHKWPFNYRGSNIPSACNGMQYNFNDLKYIPLKKGEAIIYDHRLIHATPPNTSNSERISIVLNLIPGNSELIHCHQIEESSKSVDIYKVDEEFYWKFTFTYPQNVMPAGYQKVKTEIQELPDYSRVYRELEHLIKT